VTLLRLRKTKIGANHYCTKTSKTTQYYSTIQFSKLHSMCTFDLTDINKLIEIKRINNNTIMNYIYIYIILIYIHKCIYKEIIYLIVNK